jgi:adenylate cyclase
MVDGTMVERAFSADDLAARSASTPERVRALVEAGVLTPAADGSFEPSDINRIRVAEALEASGISLADIATAVAAGELSFGFVGGLLPPIGYLPDTTMGAFSVEHAVPWELVSSSLIRFGLPVPGRAEPIREDDAEIFPSAAAALGFGLSEEALARFSRLVGETLRKLAEAQVDLYDTTVVRPMIAAGVPEIQVLENAAQMGQALAPMLEGLLLWVFRRHQEHAILEDVIEHVEAALDRAGVASKRAERTSAIAFMDLSGFTRLTETQGDHAAAELAAALAELVQDAAHTYGGQPVKFLGDGVMFHFGDPASAMACALELVDGAREAGLPPAHVGIHAGPVVYRDGDYFGRTVNLAARIADKAGPGDVFVNEETMDTVLRGAAASAPAAGHGFGFERIGPAELKGVERPVTLFRVTRA